MTAPRYLADGECWRVVGLRDAAAFFGAVSQLLPDATHVFLEGAPAPAVVALISQHSAPVEYRAPAGTLWSWPRSHRFALAASPALFSQLAEASTRHAEPEICDHLHFYREAEPLAHWFDAFAEALLVSKLVPRKQVEEFCRATGGALVAA